MQSENSQEQLAYVSVRQLLLAPLNVSPIFDGEDVGPLVAITDHGTALIILTGCVDGPVKVMTQMCPEPAPDPNHAWEVVEEVDLLIDDALYLSSPTWAELHTPVFQPATAGRHRIGVSGRGRNVAPGLSVFSTWEEYLIQA